MSAPFPLPHNADIIRAPSPNEWRVDSDMFAAVIPRFDRSAKEPGYPSGLEVGSAARR